MGVAERPDTKPMQAMTDALRGLLVVLPPDMAATRATIRHSADMMELQTDWLLDQHRLIERLSTQVAEALALVEELLGKRPG